MAANRISQFKAEILYNKKEKGGSYRLGFSAPAISKRCLPGQFLTLRLTGGQEPLLRRPFSIHKAAGPNIEILYELVGRGTEILSRKKPKEGLDIIGPLGNGFALRSRQAIIIAGGMGAAPLIFLAEKLRESKAQSPKSKVIVLLGAKTKSRLLCEREFGKLGCAVKIATDDGSRGYKGKVTQLLERLLSTIDYPCLPDRQGLSTIYGCGPRPMLKEVAFISGRHRLPAQLSLEEHMACGIGACLGCAVNTKDGYKRVCKDGPVFDADRIIWQ